MSQPAALFIADVLENDPCSKSHHDAASAELRRLYAMTERTLTDEVIADLWHQSGGFHHHFAHAIERYLKGQA